jgi:hypothetical protein
MPEEGNARSRNPNICASCSSMADGMDDTTKCETARFAPGQGRAHARTEASARAWSEDEATEPIIHHLPVWR